MSETLDKIIGTGLVLVGAGGIVAGIASNTPQGYTGAIAGLGAIVGGYKCFLEKCGI